MGKNFRALFPFVKKFSFWNLKDKHLTLTLKSTSGKKICKIKFTQEESDTIIAAASFSGQSLEQFFDSLLKELVEGEKRKTHLPKM